MRPKTAWTLCLLAGIVVAALTVLIGSVNPQACDGNAAFDPVTRFQWVRSVADVQALFGAEPCRSTLAAALDRVNRIDLIAYIPAFTLFQLFAAAALTKRGRTLARVAAIAAIAAAICDVIEDNILLGITAALPGDQASIDTLFWFPRLKYALLAGAAGCLGLLLARERHAARWCGLAMVAGGGVALIGLFAPRLLSAGIGAAWAALLVAALLQVLRRPATPA